MRRKGLWLSVLATALIAGSASAVSVTSSNLLGNGTFQWLNYAPLTTSSQDWAEGNVTVNASPISGVQNEMTQSEAASLGLTLHDAGTTGPAVNQGALLGGDSTTPGGGGQNFDIEQAFYGFNGNTSGGTLYIGIVTGFDPTGVRTGGLNYFAGDLFLNLGDTNVGPSAAYDVALGTSYTSTVAGTPDTAARDGLAWDLTSAYTASPVNVPSHTSVANPFRVLTGSAYTGTYEVNWLIDILGNGSDHNLLEIALNLNATQALSLQAGGFGAHWTMTCGNDILPIQGTVIVPNAPVPVPAAAPLGLLGMGLIALVRRVRRRPEC
jgi:hypothetical protein